MIFGVKDGEDMVFLRNSLGLLSLCNVIESRRRKFMDRLLDNDVFTVVIEGFFSNLFCSFFIFHFFEIFYFVFSHCTVCVLFFYSLIVLFCCLMAR